MHASANSDQRMKRSIANGIPTTVIVSSDDGAELGEHSPGQGPQSSQHSAVCLAGEHGPSGVDLVEDDGDHGGRDDRREQAADAADQHRQEGGHRAVSAVERDQRRDAREMEDHPLDRGGDEVDGNEDRARRGEGREVLGVDSRVVARKI